MEKKTAAKVEGVKAAVKEAVAETKEQAKEAREVVKEQAKEAKEVVKEQAKEAKESVKTKKATRAVKKAKAAREELKPEVYIQFQGHEAMVADAIEKAKAQFVAEGHRVSSIKSLQVYLKPEEYAAYYVINQKVAGKVDLF